MAELMESPLRKAAVAAAGPHTVGSEHSIDSTTVDRSLVHKVADRMMIAVDTQLGLWFVVDAAVSCRCCSFRKLHCCWLLENYFDRRKAVVDAALHMPVRVLALAAVRKLAVGGDHTVAVALAHYSNTLVLDFVDHTVDSSFGSFHYSFRRRPYFVNTAFVGYMVLTGVDFGRMAAAVDCTDSVGIHCQLNRRKSERSLLAGHGCSCCRCRS